MCTTLAGLPYPVSCVGKDRHRHRIRGPCRGIDNLRAVHQADIRQAEQCGGGGVAPYTHGSETGVFEQPRHQRFVGHRKRQDRIVDEVLP